MREDNRYLFLNKFLSIKGKLNDLGQKISEKKLVVFDYKVLVLIIISFLFFLLLVVFKVHGSSIASWNNYIPDGENASEKGLLFGSPKAIRSDEWLVSTPFALSQAESSPRFPLQNEALGEGNVPMLMNLPVEHASTIFRPQHWGYFFLRHRKRLLILLEF